MFEIMRWAIALIALSQVILMAQAARYVLDCRCAAAVFHWV